LSYVLKKIISRMCQPEQECLPGTWIMVRELDLRHTGREEWLLWTQSLFDARDTLTPAAVAAGSDRAVRLRLANGLLAFYALQFVDKRPAPPVEMPSWNGECLAVFLAHY
jgi:hypothetical protein